MKNKILRAALTAGLVSLAISCLATTRPSDPQASQTNQTPAVPQTAKVLGQGQYAKLTHAFVAVIRDGETYAALVKLEPSLPKLKADYFDEHTVVAAFLGSRGTGGYSVEIGEGTKSIQIKEVKPPADAMLTQAVTSPFKVISLESLGDPPIWLDLDEPWTQSLNSYRVTSGRFRTTGGFSGITQEYGLSGTVRISRAGDVLGFEFDLTGDSENGSRLKTFASGVVRDGQVRIARLSAGSLIPAPISGLRADGLLREKQGTVSLSLFSRPSLASDSYVGQGTIEAELSKAVVKK